MIIYKITNLINGKFYVGKDERNLDKYLGSGLKLKRAIKKYGCENFKKEILEYCDTRQTLCEREIFWIKELDAINKGYNIALGGAGGDTYSKNPNLDLIKEKFKGNKNPFYGKHHPKELQDRLNKGRFGRIPWNKGKNNIYSEDTKDKMAKARSALTGETSSRYIKVEKDVLINSLSRNTIVGTAKELNLSVSCVRMKMKLFEIDFSKLNKEEPTTLVYRK